MVPLYSKGTAAKRKTAMASIEGKEGVADFNRKEFLQYERSMDPSMLRQARADDNYVNTLQSSKFGSNLQSAPFIFNMGGVNAAGGNEASAEYQQFLMFKKMMGENN